MMMRQPPELFTDRPVRSDYYGRRSSGPTLLKRFLSICVVLGLGALVWWSYQAWVSEDVPPGEIPTIEAEGPLMKRPEQPGGLDVPHQDVLVFQQLEKNPPIGEPRPAEHLLPPPETPQTLQEEPLFPAENTEAQPAPLPAEEAQEENLPPPITVGQPIRKEKLIEDAKAVADVVKEAETAQTKKVEKAAPEAAKVVEQKTEEVKKAESAVARLPKELFTGDAVPEKTEPVKKKTEPVIKAVQKVVTKPAPGKGVRVQLASFSDKTAAESAVGRFEKKYASAIEGVSLNVVRADLGTKGIFYRIMSDPVTADKAKSICDDLKQLKAGCLIAR